jgi:hypothetical protein
MVSPFGVGAGVEAESGAGSCEAVGGVGVEGGRMRRALVLVAPFAVTLALSGAHGGAQS